ncbi:MAG: hypothetical protein Q8S14_14830 [Algoriphagus sp.]|uniref:hypothetical protein n=1 Tax=Algoriphagus sp. TaxID=1872435 RepID=UPI002731454A|nr:hypothetical protein [Algoriphagus sp.]MDP2041691.1 hypothetical protein [Algoriphagus sp.]MDP3473142.1 hypothetical protein [Algoriphagus sp.]
MKAHFLTLAAFLLTQFGIVQSKSEKENQFSDCSNYILTEEDDFGRGTLIKSKPIQVGDGLWLSSSSVGSEKKLIVNIVFSGTSNQAINPNETHEFSLDGSDEKILIKMTPSEIKSPVSKIETIGGSEYIPISMSNSTTYTLIYDLTHETYEHFKTNLLNSIRINSLSADFPFKATRKTKLKFFRNTLACLDR